MNEREGCKCALGFEINGIVARSWSKVGFVKKEAICKKICKGNVVAKAGDNEGFRCLQFF